MVYGRLGVPGGLVLSHVALDLRPGAEVATVQHHLMGEKIAVDLVHLRKVVLGLSAVSCSKFKLNEVLSAFRFFKDETFESYTKRRNKLCKVYGTFAYLC